MTHPAEILVIDRFKPLRDELLDLLASLEDTDWTAAATPSWSVKDVAAHLLGGDVGILSRERDEWLFSSTSVTYEQLVQLVNRLNDEWVVAARRMSVRVLRELLAHVGPQVDAYFASLDPRAMGGPISWAGPDRAPVWFDIAREFTERWHHQQQIRDATARPPLYDSYFFAPVLATFALALPHSLRQTIAPLDTVIQLEIPGPSGGVWCVQRGEHAWGFVAASTKPPTTTVELAPDVAWRLFTKGLSRDEAHTRAVIRGEMRFATPILATTAVIG
jgi:uncharacterized protein (TIGR03083 family)